LDEEVMVLFKKIYIYFDGRWCNDYPESRRLLSLVMAPGTLIPIRGLSPEEELQFFGFNCVSFHWYRFSFGISFKYLPKTRYHDFCWNSLMLWYYRNIIKILNREK
jgi:hypothetical protein